MLDADGSVLYDLFDNPGIAEPDDIGWRWTPPGMETDGGVIRKKLAGVTRGIDDDPGGSTRRVSRLCR